MARQTIVATVKPGYTASAVDDVMSNAATTVTDLTTVLSDFDIAMGSGIDNLATLLGASTSYSTTTHQMSGTMGGNATITPTQGAALYALFNTVATDILAAIAAAGKANSTSDVVVSANVSTVKTISTLKQLLANIRQNFEATGQLTP